MNLAAIACANGLGHVRRMIAILTFMMKNGYQGYVDAYMPKTHIAVLKNWPECQYFISNDRISIYDFCYPKDNWIKTNSLFELDWQSIKLPNLSKYDTVWSDNILNVLKYRSDAIISGSFFWHEIFESRKQKNGLQKFVENQRALLESSDPVVIGNEYFSTKEVMSLKNYKAVGLYRYSMIFGEKLRKCILISCGLGGEEESLTRQAVLRIIKENIEPDDILYVEPRLLPDNYPDWIHKADYSNEMFNNCLAVCIRPGMGTISDSLISRNKIFAFCKEDSYEMLNNIEVLEKLKLGQRCNDPYEGYIMANDYIGDQSEINNQIMRTSHLRSDGVFATANILTSRL